MGFSLGWIWRKQRIGYNRVSTWKKPDEPKHLNDSIDHGVED